MQNEKYINKPNMKKLTRLFPILVAAGFILASCEGPMGPAGTPGVDANETCKQCHNQDVVDAKKLEYEHSRHAESSDIAEEYGTRNACAPCHSHQGFLAVVKNNTPATFTVNPSDPTKYINNYTADAGNLNLPAGINCFTCHTSLHTSYTEDDFFPLANEVPVPMTMWGGTKTITLAKTSAHLCAKCHQPRPVTASSGNMIDYAKLVSEPATTYNLSNIGFRTGVHYGVQASMFAGVGGVEFGTGYTNSVHAAQASCASCHMAAPSGLKGGHSFAVAGNFNGCNTCHTGLTATSPLFTATQTEIKGLIDALAAKINLIGAGHDILQKDPVDNQYHGYFDVFDASNPTGYWRNPANGSPAFPALTNAQFGAIINFQLLVRDKSLGVHNYPYMKKLLENTIAAI